MRADGAAPSCTDAYVQGQHLLSERRLLDAERALLVCARDPCSRTLQPECAEWLAEAKRLMPSVVILAQGGSGGELRRARVILDGRVFLEELDGTSKDVDPGAHLFRVEAPGETAIEQRIVIHEGEKARLLPFHFAPSPSSPAPTTPPTETSAAPRWPVFLFGALTLVGAASWAYFGISGLALRHDIDACTSGCDPSRRSALDVDWDVADVSIGVTLLSAGLAAYFFVRTLHPEAKAKASAAPSLRVRPGLVRGGAGHPEAGTLWLEGSF